MCKRIIVVPQVMGKVPTLLLGKSRLEIPGHQLLALAAHSSARERLQRVHPRYRQAKETKCGEMAVGCRSTRIVLMKPGNWSRGTGWREGKTERGCLMLDPGSGNTSEASNLELRINETAQDRHSGYAAMLHGESSIRGTVCSSVGTYGSVGALGEHLPGPPGPWCAALSAKLWNVFSRRAEAFCPSPRAGD